MDRLPYLVCPPLESGYRDWFTDPTVWAPYVAEVARRHGLPAPRSLSARMPGSHPVLVAESGYVVKFYAPHWPDDALCERQAYVLLRSVSKTAIPRPSLSAAGCLFPGHRAWEWPYSVMEIAEGQPTVMAADALGSDEWMDLAGELGRIVRTLHGVSLTHAGEMRAQSERALAHLVRTAPDRRRAEPAWRRLDFRSWDAYWAAAHSCSAPPVMVHGDLTADHVYVRIAPGHVRVTSLIDWADAMIGDAAYELVPLYLDLFQGRPERLRAFRTAYGDGPMFGPGWEKRATAYLAAFRFDLGAMLTRLIPRFSGLIRLEEVEGRLWGDV